MTRLDAYLVDMEGRYSGRYREALSALLVAMARGDKPASATARRNLEDVIGTTMAIAQVAGAGDMLRQAAGAMLDEGVGRFSADSTRSMVCFRDDQPMFSHVTFDEAVQDILQRTPAVLRNSAERTAQAVAKLYSQGRYIAFAKAAEQSVADRVRDLIAEAVRDGLHENEAGGLIRAEVSEIREKTADWSESYARMVFRTNVGTAVTAGRFRQARDPDVAAVIPCFRFDAVMDPDTRHNHGAANGRIYLTTNPVWQTIAPPLGYNCRCHVSNVTKPMLRRMGRLSQSGAVMEDSVPAGAGPDHGFRHGPRPDILQ